MNGSVLRGERERRAWSQREVAARLGVAQPFVSAYELGRRHPTVPQLERFAEAFGTSLAIELVPRPVDGTFVPATLVDTAEALVPDSRDIARPVYEFIRGYREAPPFERRGLLVEEPPCTGSRRHDALLAGIAEHLACRDHESVPSWTAHPGRFLSEAWYWVDIRSRREVLRAVSPAAFARRMIFVDPVDLETV